MQNFWPLILVLAAILLLLFMLFGRKRTPKPNTTVQQRTNTPADHSQASEPAGQAVFQRTETVEQANYLEADDDGTIGGDFYSEVAALLKQVLVDNPDRQDIRLKLLDVYFDSGNRDAYVTEARRYKEGIGKKEDPSWKTILEKGASLAPDEELFRSRPKPAASPVQPTPATQGSEKKAFRRFGDIPEARIPLEALANAYQRLRTSAQFHAQLDRELIRMAGRPTQMMLARHLSQENQGAQIFIKREDHAGRFPRMRIHLMGQAWIARRLGMTEIVYAANGGEEAVLAAQAAAKVGIKCKIFISVQRGQYREIHRQHCELMGAEIRETMAGHESGDIRYAALESWLTAPKGRFMMLNLAAGPHPYPTLTSDLQSVIGRECLRQVMGNTGKAPKAIFARAGNNSDAIGFVEPFLKLRETEIHLVSTLDSEDKPARDSEEDSVYNTLYSTHQVRSAMSVLEGMEFPKIERELSLLKSTGRITYGSARLSEARSALSRAAKKEGLITPIETAHVLAYACQQARKLTSQDAIVVMLSEQLDKEMMTIAVE